MKPVQRALRAAVRQRLVEVIEQGSDPLTFLTNIVADKSIDLQTRMYAAEVLLPYTAPRQCGCPPRVDDVVQHPVKTLNIPS
jgi:hypothetical protein